jgi:hypothetical protein
MRFFLPRVFVYTWKNLVATSPSLSLRTRDSYLAMVRWSEASPSSFNFSAWRSSSSCVANCLPSRVDSRQRMTSVAMASFVLTLPMKRAL